MIIQGHFNDKILGFLLVNAMLQFYLAPSKHAKMGAKNAYISDWVNKSVMGEASIPSFIHFFFFSDLFRPQLSDLGVWIKEGIP